jgi:hypothetical protein
VPESEKKVLDEGARNVEAALQKPEVIALLERFDARFDDNLAVLASRNEP